MRNNLTIRLPLLKECFIVYYALNFSKDRKLKDLYVGTVTVVMGLRKKKWGLIFQKE